MQDSEIVTAITAGDADGLAAAYDRYAAPLHDFCFSLLGVPAEAAEAVQDTFAIAGARAGGLRDADRLKPWLYAVARNECHRRLRERAGPDHAGETGDVTEDTIDLGHDLERAEWRAVVATTVAALSPGEREVIELSLRHDFSDEDLAAALGISRHQARELSARTCRRFEDSLGALHLARSGRPSCAALDELLEGWDGQRDGQQADLLRRHLSRHMRQCRGCADRRHRDLQPATLLAVLPVMRVARSQRPQVLGMLAAMTPYAVAYRARVLADAGPFGESGFPVPADPPRPVHGRRRSLVAVAAVAAIAAAGAAVIEAGTQPAPRPQPLSAAASVGRQIPGPAAGTPSGSLVPRRNAAKPARYRAAAATPTLGPTPALQGTAAAPGTIQPTLTRPPGSPPPSSPLPSSPPPSHSPPPSSPPPPASPLSVSPGSVTLGPSPSGGNPSGSFTLTASSASSYSIVVPASYAGTLSVSPAAGSLAAGASVTITVTWNSTASLQTSLSINPGSAVSVSYQAQPGLAGG
jgi:RNA polymerase sigma factor (sigma-70 family)